MPIDFPNSPANGDTYTVGSKTWSYNGTSWVLLQSDALVGSGSISSDKLAADSVTEAKIASSAVTEAKLASSAVTEAKLASSAVTSGKIASNAVTHDKLHSTLSAVTICTSSTKPASPFDGQMIYMTNVDQTAVWDGSAWVGLAPIAGGRNMVVNGDFKIWQRGTSFTNPANGQFTADRWFMYYDGSAATRTISQQTFTGDNPTGLNVSNYMRFAQTVAGTGGGTNGMFSRIEDVRKLNNQTVTLSFYGKADASRTVIWQTYQEFGTGGSSAVLANSQSFTFTSTWQRFSVSFLMPSVSGKTIASNSSVSFIVNFPVNATGTFDITGIQLEAGAVATPFEFEDYGTTLAKCQRYYWRTGYGRIGHGIASSTTVVKYAISVPVTMRANPTTIDYNNIIAFDGVNYYSGGTWAIDATTTNDFINVAYTHGSGVFTQYRPYFIANLDASTYIGFSAEL